ncbi:MAG TPA: hypothetical protein VM736_15490 [Gemmatimonadales bacterium]|nr:hypothetical protein [Gemmatimonadales bacterium]
MTLQSRLAFVAFLAGLSRGAAAQGSAQTAGVPFADGIRAYQDLRFEQAAALLRRDLARVSPATASVAERTQGLAYLGAADLFRGQRDSAVAVFRRLVRLDPRYRPAALLFPRTVTNVFDSVKVETRTILVVTPPDTEFSAGAGAYRFWVVSSGFQSVEVSLRYQDGGPFRTLYVGPIGDSLRVQWDGLDAAAQPPSVKRVLLRVTSRAPTGELAGIVQQPLDVHLVHPDTLAWPRPPADSLFLPERAGSGPAQRAILGGVLLGGLIAALPTVVGGDPPSGPRFAVAGTVGVAAMLGSVLHRPGRLLPANIATNQKRRDQWQRYLAGVKADNARRRDDIHVAVRAGEATAMLPSGR